MTLHDDNDGDRGVAAGDKYETDDSIAAVSSEFRWYYCYIVDDIIAEIANRNVSKTSRERAREFRSGVPQRSMIRFQNTPQL